MKKNNSEFLKEKEKGKRPENPAGTNPSDKSARKKSTVFLMWKNLNGLGDLVRS